MRSLGISLLSVALTSVVVANAYYQKKQFYPSVVYITKSNPSMAVIYIQAFIGVWIAGKIMRKIFFGQLRTTEFEHLMERSWYAITETCLAFTVFRDDFNPKFVALFTLLLFLKSFHWLAEDRVDYMERSPIISWIFHIRVLSLLLLLLSLDMYFINQAYQSTVSKGASVQLVFGFEYAILLTVVINIAIKYALHSVDLNSETPWDNKAVFLLYTELVMGLIKVVLYVAFVAIMVRIYTLPLFAFRPMYFTIRNFKKAFSDVILSRRAIHNMNTLYPDATAEELAAADNVCIICREEMTTASKKLPCNHIFHTSCLRSWFQRQQTCPTCRLNILQSPAAMADRQQPAPPRQQAPAQPAGAAGQNPFALPQAFFGPGFLGQRPGGDAGQNQRIGGFVPPPFPFPPAPFMAPAPPPPRDLGSMTPEELRRLEQSEREGVEARIQCLRNIQMLLDAAVMMMQQYSTAAALAAPLATPGTGAATAASTSGTSNSVPSTNTATPAAGPSTANGSVTCNGATTSTTNYTTEGDTPTTVTNKSTPNITSTTTPTPVSSSSNDPTTTARDASPEEELRRRRLQKFETPPPQQ